MPGDIGNIAGDVIERAGNNLRFVCKARNRCTSRYWCRECRCDHSLVIRATSQPPACRALPDETTESSPDVGTDEMIGALKFRRPPLLVIGQRQTQSGDPEKLKIRQASTWLSGCAFHCGRTTTARRGRLPFFDLAGKNELERDCFRPCGGMHRAGPGELIRRELKSSIGGQGIKVVARHSAPFQCAGSNTGADRRH